MKVNTEILLRGAEWVFKQADKAIDLWLERRKPEPSGEPPPRRPRSPSLESQPGRQTALASAQLTIIEGRERGRQVPLTLWTTTLGRERINSIVLRDTKVSRRHAEIRRQDGSFVLQDLNSQNGTFVNGQRISTAVALQPGDEIRIGDTVLRFDR